MVFSEPVFLFLFLPAVLGLYALVPSAARNVLLLMASLFFYAWGEELYVLVLLVSIALNYAVGLALARARNIQTRRVWLVVGVAVNLGILGYFKYLGFIFESLGMAHLAEAAPPLPIGISFFTFQALSYIVDLYFRRVHVQRSPFLLALYISMFPQLIAGPIVRYAEVEAAIVNRRTGQGDVSYGVHRFVIGLAKKTLIADPLGLVADQIFGLPNEALSPTVAWLGATTYALQLYFDFSAYSDMAIGLGRVFGFRFPENFNYPYASRSVTEFWRRWHMTLSRWFRDYLYIPLGGNRHGSARTYVNLTVVFLATGLWHGAAWTFVFWGAYHGAWLVLERIGLGRILKRLPAMFQHGYLLLVVILGWVPFRSETFDQALSFWRAMLFGWSGREAGFFPTERFADPYVFGLVALGALLSVPWAKTKVTRLHGQLPDVWRRLFTAVGVSLAFGAAIVSVGAASYSPFIYFRF